ncbi:hypothetical protein BH23GEM9_BH23GEM9_05000 [soil metagenome]
MNIRCPNCQTAFRVNPAKIPPGGVRARCARCSATFAVKPESAAAQTEQTGGAGGGSPAYAGAPATQARTPTVPTPPPAVPRPWPPPQPVAARSTAASGGTTAAQGAAAATAGGNAAAGRPSVFGSSDPSARAQRMARALVSDIVAYHPKRRDECLAAGTLRNDFREEIMKSWEEYVAQVGLDMAKSTPFFRNALNDILAKGQQLF